MVLAAWAWLAAVCAACLAPAARAQHIVPSDTIPEYLAKYGIEVQEHTIITDDGYILTAFRLPRSGAPVILFQHGILSSAWCWIDNEPSLAPALQAYSMGYDVWLTNSRGNRFSVQHQHLKPFLDKAFWDFSFGDMGRHDVPSNIKYILSQTGQAKLAFVGHSQGTSQFFVAMTDPNLRAFVEDKVSLFVALAPVTYLQHQTGLLLDVVSRFKLGALIEDAFPFGIFTDTNIEKFASFLCKATLGLVCSVGVDVVCGSSKEDTPGAITNISAHFPSGTSVKGLNHFEQLINSNEFRDYDYGTKGNMDKYKSETPPVFDLSGAKVPTALFIGAHDYLGDPTDEEHAASIFNPQSLVFKEEFADFSHITWIAGNAASFQLWFPKLQDLLKKHHPILDERPRSATASEIVV